MATNKTAKAPKIKTTNTTPLAILAVQRVNGTPAQQEAAGKELAKVKALRGAALERAMDEAAARGDRATLERLNPAPKQSKLDRAILRDTPSPAAEKPAKPKRVVLAVRANIDEKLAAKLAPVPSDAAHNEAALQVLEEGEAPDRKCRTVRDHYLAYLADFAEYSAIYQDGITRSVGEFVGWLEGQKLTTPAKVDTACLLAYRKRAAFTPAGAPRKTRTQRKELDRVRAFLTSLGEAVKADLSVLRVLETAEEKALRLAKAEAKKAAAQPAAAPAAAPAKAAKPSKAKPSSKAAKKPSKAKPRKAAKRTTAKRAAKRTAKRGSK